MRRRFRRRSCCRACFTTAKAMLSLTLTAAPLPLALLHLVPFPSFFTPVTFVRRTQPYLTRQPMESASYAPEPSCRGWYHHYQSEKIPETRRCALTACSELLQIRHPRYQVSQGGFSCTMILYIFIVAAEELTYRHITPRGATRRLRTQPTTDSETQQVSAPLERRSDCAQGAKPEVAASRFTDCCCRRAAS